MTTIDWLLLNPEEICKMAVDQIKDSSDSKKDVASEAALQKVCGEDCSPFEYRVAFRVLEERDSNLLGDAIYVIAKRYNVLRAKIMNNFPILAKMSWDIYKMTGVSFRSPVFSSMLKTSSDEEFARFYARQQIIGFGQREGFEIFEDWNGFDLVGQDKLFMLGVGKYLFRDRRNHLLETIWDLREERLPRFEYTKVQ